MAENSELRQPTHRVYSVIRGEQGDCLIDIGHASPRIGGPGYDILLHAMPEDGELVCRQTGSCDPSRDIYAIVSAEAPEQDTIAATSSAR
jgi:hypothetical protein